MFHPCKLPGSQTPPPRLPRNQSPSRGLEHAANLDARRAFVMAARPPKGAPAQHAPLLGPPSLNQPCRRLQHLDFNNISPSVRPSPPTIITHQSMSTRVGRKRTSMGPKRRRARRRTTTRSRSRTRFTRATVRLQASAWFGFVIVASAAARQHVGARCCQPPTLLPTLLSHETSPHSHPPSSPQMPVLSPANTSRRITPLHTAPLPTRQPRKCHAHTRHPLSAPDNASAEPR